MISRTVVWGSFNICVLVVILLRFSTPAMAADGENVFKGVCGGCHGKGGEARDISPVKFAGKQWERFFNKKRHNRKKDISELLSEQDQTALIEYLIEHAADSDKPIAAGLR